MNTLLPLDASCWDLGVDPNLSFLDSWVHQQVITGLVPAVPYRSRGGETEKMINRGRKTSRAATKGKLRYSYDPPTSLAAIDRPVVCLFLSREQATYLSISLPSLTLSTLSLSPLLPLTPALLPFLPWPEDLGVLEVGEPFVLDRLAVELLLLEGVMLLEDLPLLLVHSVLLLLLEDLRPVDSVVLLLATTKDMVRLVNHFLSLCRPIIIIFCDFLVSVPNSNTLVRNCRNCRWFWFLWHDRC